MRNAARKCNMSENADFYSTAGNESMAEVRVPEILPSCAPVLKVTDRNGPTIAHGVNDTCTPSLRSAELIDGYTGPGFVEHLPVLDEIKRAVPKMRIFALDDRLDMMSTIDRRSELPSYLDNYAVIKELRKLQKPRPLALLWASLTCFGVAGLLLIVMIGQL
jgi:hypothetical protein